MDLTEFCSCFILIKLFTLFTYLLYLYDVFSYFIVSKSLSFEYDYIIVGAGTAGSLIAHRLNTETNYSFLVLEAGGRSNCFLDIPVFGPLLHGSIFDWQFESVPQNKTCQALNGNISKIPQGKITGGSAKINNMVHLRGNLTQYVEWFHDEYNLSYIEKQFDFIEENLLHVNQPVFESLLSNAVIQASEELNFPESDLNEEFKEGFMKSTLNQHRGQRWTTYNKLSESSEQVIKNAKVMKILINRNKVAYGVQFECFGMMYEVFAKKGVIVSAGTLNSPKLLQLSGVGPKSLLNRLDIPVIQDLPVGQNLQDHVTTGIDLLVFNQTIELKTIDLLNPFYMIVYLVMGRGPLSFSGCEVVGFISTNGTKPDIQLMVLPVGIASDQGVHLKNVISVKDNVWEEYFSTDQTTASIIPILINPKSRGEVMINSKDFNEPLLINPNYLSHPDDVITLINGLKFIEKLVDTDSMKALTAYMNPKHFPGCEEFELFSDAYWECYIRHLTLTTYHPVGTCKMGSPCSKSSVVDTKFKVIGVDNLYVVDGSVLPTIPSVNVNAPIAMMASVFFDTIAKDNSCAFNSHQNVCKKLSYLDNMLHSKESCYSHLGYGDC